MRVEKETSFDPNFRLEVPAELYPDGLSRLFQESADEAKARYDADTTNVLELVVHLLHVRVVEIVEPFEQGWTADRDRAERAEAEIERLNAEIHALRVEMEKGCA